MSELEQRLSGLRETMDETIFKNVSVPEQLIRRVKSRVSDPDAVTVTKPASRRFSLRWAALAALPVILLWFAWQIMVPPAMAMAFTLKPEGVQSLFDLTLGGDREPAKESMPLDIDSYNRLYYSWSPNGKYLVYGNAGDLFVFDAETKAIANITNTPDRWELMPSWSPDGERIGFVRRALLPEEKESAAAGAGQWSMHGPFAGSPAIVKRDGTEYRTLAEGETGDPVTWSPDGRMAAFSLQGKLYLSRLDGEEVTVLDPGRFGLQSDLLLAPSWSPTEDKIAVLFQYAKPGNQNRGYAVIDLAARTYRVLLENTDKWLPLQPQAKWNPAGDRLAVMFTPGTGLTGKETGLIVMDAAEGKPKLLGPAYQAVWEPDGKRIAYIDNGDRSVIRIAEPANAADWRESETYRHDRFIEGLAWRPKADTGK